MTASSYQSVPAFPESLETGTQYASAQHMQERHAGILQQSSHPVTVIFHLLFRTVAILFYLFSSWLGFSFVFVFVMTILLLAFDFWTVKNISGRLLVGLRWWNQVKEDGTSAWIFEFNRNPQMVNPADYRIFWWSLYVYSILWLFFAISALLQFSLSWLIVVLFALMLNIANVLGYTWCDKDAKKKLVAGMSSSLIGSLLKSQFGAAPWRAPAPGEASPLSSHHPLGSNNAV